MFKTGVTGAASAVPVFFFVWRVKIIVKPGAN